MEDIRARDGVVEGIEIGDGVNEKVGAKPSRDKNAAGSSPTFSSSGTCSKLDCRCDFDR